MLNVDENALECDLAETYHIYNYRELPLKKVALFSVGLRENSRIKLRISNQKYMLSDLLLANAVDRLSLLIWIVTGAKKNKQPDLITPKMSIENCKDDSTMVFTSGEDFERKRKEILEKMGGN